MAGQLRRFSTPSYTPGWGEVLSVFQNKAKTTLAPPWPGLAAAPFNHLATAPHPNTMSNLTYNIDIPYDGSSSLVSVLL